MNLYAAGGLVAVGSALLYYFADKQPADVYDMPMDEVYAQLKQTDLGEATKAEWSSLTTSNTGNGKDKLTWKRHTSHSSQTCEIRLSPFEGDAERTHVAINCNLFDLSAGGAQGMVHRISRNANIERIDAALTGRPFDKDRAGSTASGWPGDGVDGSLGTAIGNAVRMDADMRRKQAEFEAEEARPEGW